MAYGLVAQERKALSDVVAAVGEFESENGVSRYTTTVNVKGTAANIEAIGFPVVWTDADSAFKPYVAQTISTVASTTSPLPNGGKVALLVGDNRGAGFNTADVAINATTDVKFTALYSGDAAIKVSGIKWGDAVDANHKAFLAELAAQGVRVAKEASVISVSY